MCVYVFMYAGVHVYSYDNNTNILCCTLLKNGRACVLAQPTTVPSSQQRNASVEHECSVAGGQFISRGAAAAICFSDYAGGV